MARTDISVVSNSITEWWIYPLVTSLEAPSRRIVYGAIGADLGDGTANVVACEVNQETGATTRVNVGTVPVDDHNCPALWARDGRRSVMAWTDHGMTATIWLKVSNTAGSVQSLGSATEQTIAAPGGASYTQIHRIEHLSNSLQDTFWLFSRIGAYTWRMVPFSVNQSTGTITSGTWVHLLTGSGQAYISTTDAHHPSTQTIRVLWGHNPASPTAVVYSFDINATTGVLTSIVDPTFVASLSGGNLPMTDASMVPLLPELPTSRSRRLFYGRPGPMPHAVAYAEWDNATPDDAIYYVTQLDGMEWVTTSYGIAGPRFGYNSGANYIAGMSFPDPCPRDVVAVANVTGNVSRVSVYTEGTEKVLAQYTGSHRLIRPMFPTGYDDRLVFSQVMTYGTIYTDYQSFTRTAFPGGFQTTNLPDGTPVQIY